MESARIPSEVTGEPARPPGTPEADSDPHAWMDEPTDSESPDAPHNPDVFELRSRVRKLRGLVRSRDAQIAALAARDGEARELRDQLARVAAIARMADADAFTRAEDAPEWVDQIRAALGAVSGNAGQSPDQNQVM